MSLLDRLRGVETPRLIAHAFQGMLFEWADGASGISRSTLVSSFNLSEEDEVELDILKSYYDNANTFAKKMRLKMTLDNILMIISDRTLSVYTTNAEVNARLTEVAG